MGLPGLRAAKSLINFALSLWREIPHLPLSREMRRKEKREIFILENIMKYKILTMLLVFLLLAGCKVELPEQAAGSVSAASAASSILSSSQGMSSVEGASSEQSETVSQSSSLQAASKDLSPASAAATVSSASTSSAKTAPRTASSPSSAAPEKKELTYSLTISCSDILAHKEQFTQEQLEVVPANGTILQENNISFQEGETVFQVLLRITKQKNISMIHLASPAFQTEYVSSIDNISEKAYGSSSGWLFAVNGKQPAVGCSAYKLKDGDKIQWIFNCGQ
jgi:hypothetical protein